MDIFLTDWVEWSVHTVFFWEKDNERKGRIVHAIHHFTSAALIVMIILSHTLYRSFWLQTVLLIVMMFIWVHHMLIRDCVITCVERRLMNKRGGFWSEWVEFLGVDPTPETQRAVMLSISTTVFVCLSLEWVANVLWGFSRILHPFS